MKKYIILLLLIIGIVSCSSAPDVRYESGKFAHFNKNRKMFKAVSSNNTRIMIYRVETGQTEETLPELWINEIVLTLKTKGYNLLKNETFQSDMGKNVSYAEFETFYNGEPYIYSLAIIPHQNDLIVSEASGRKDDYIGNRDEIIRIIKSIQE